MKTLYYRTFEKVLSITFIFSILLGTFGPVGAKADDEVNETPVTMPEVEVLPAKATWFVTATAYSSDIWQNDATPFLPANGVDYRKVFETEGAVNCIAFNDLRLGAKVRFPDLHGDKIFTVCDRTNAKYTGTKRADFYFYSVDDKGRIDSKTALDMARANAKVFGVKRKLKMEIVSFTPAPKVVNQSVTSITMK